MASHALFFAVKPDASAAAQLLALGRGLREQHGLTGKLFEVGRLHVTLHFFGRYPSLDPALVQRLARVGGEVRGEPFRAGFDRVGSFRRPSNAPLVVRMHDDAPGIRVLHERLASALVLAGFAPRSAQPFVPHLTLLYDDKSLAEQAIAPIEWTVDAFELVHSESGAGHRVLNRWPLQPA